MLARLVRLPRLRAHASRAAVVLWAGALAWALGGGPACSGPQGPESDAGGLDATDATDPTDASPLAPRFPACDPTAAVQTVTFVHVSDMHSTFHPDGPTSPPARLRGYFEQVRVENPFTLFTNAGDDHEKGWLAEQRSQGSATVELVHALGFDVRTLGNHDFAWGPEGILAYSRDPRALVLSSNVRWIGPDPEAFGAVEYGTLDLGCLRLGFFGMVHKPWDERDEQYDGPYLPGYDDTRYDPVNVAQAIVSAHRDEVDLLVMVSHLGLALDEHVAEWVGGIDVILGGHSHDLLYSPVNANGALLVHAGAYAQHAFRLDVDIDLETGLRTGRRFALVENLPDVLPAAPLVEAKVRELMARFSPDADAPVAWLAEPQSYRQVAALAARAAREIHGAEAALVDVDEVWTELSPGPVSPQQLLDAFKVERAPSGTLGFSSFTLVSISGADLQRLAEGLDPSRWSLSTEDQLSLEATYSLVLQKHVSYHPADHFSGEISLGGPPFPLEEVWATFHAWAQARSAACLHLDSDLPLPACP